MYDKLSSGILTGRPFGGVGILIRKCLGITVNVVEIMSNYRVAATCLTFNNGYKLMVFIVYFPCQSNDYINELLECLGFIEKCVNLYDYDDIMILGDMNFECNTKNTGYNLFLNLCNDINIGRADLICGSDIKYTYLQDSTGKNSIIDHIFVSSRLVNDISE